MKRITWFSAVYFIAVYFTTEYFTAVNFTAVSFTVVVNIYLQPMVSLVISYMNQLDKSNDHDRNCFSNLYVKVFVFHVKGSWNMVENLTIVRN